MTTPLVLQFYSLVIFQQKREISLIKTQASQD